MHIELHNDFASIPEGPAARSLTSACVHCGFCLPACPTYVATRDERDSPRGRIYLIKHFLETGEGGSETRRHLDRCLTCRNCESACPSGMQYGDLLDIGRGLVETATPRSLPQRGVRHLLRFFFARPRLLRAGLTLGRMVRPVLPRHLRKRIPPLEETGTVPAARHHRRMLLLEGCVQSAATPNTNACARRVLDKLGISLLSAPRAGCCGALDYHLAAHARGLARMRHNIDAWWPYVEDGVEAIVSSATGCGALLADYGKLLAHDPAYADKARRVSALACDLGDVLLREDLAPLRVENRRGAVAVHTPCTLRNALGQPELIHRVLNSAGIAVTACAESSGCCGSAGTYALLQSGLSEHLKTETLKTLCRSNPEVIATGNVGCQLHLQSDTDIPVRHWIALLDDATPP